MFLKVTFESTSEFKAELCKSGGCFTLSVGAGITEALATLETKQHEDIKPQRAAVHLRPSLSFAWLLLHELCHISLHHFKVAERFGLVSRSTDTNTINLDSPAAALKCIEMQADHEASSLLLEDYSPGDWQELRQQAMAIAGMMILIELEDTKNRSDNQTHPKAATRIFQLLGHLAEMPLIQAQIEKDASLIPSKDELQAFAHEVTIPCFFDALQLAQAANAAFISDDLGSPEDFFKDLEIAKLGDPSRYGELKTQGAQEWAKLWPCNEALKPILGGHFTN